MKGSAITGPVGKEAAELWPVSATLSTSTLVPRNANIFGAAYRLQLWCRDVSGCLLRETVHMGGVRAAFYAQASSMISCLKTHPLNPPFQPKPLPQLSNVPSVITECDTSNTTFTSPSEKPTATPRGLTEYS